jgi:hypothetical protein
MIQFVFYGIISYRTFGTVYGQWIIQVPSVAAAFTRMRAYAATDGG